VDRRSTPPPGRPGRVITHQNRLGTRARAGVKEETLLAQVVIGVEGVAQGAILASILAGFAFAGATTVRDRGTVVLYFASGLLMLLSAWAGLMALLATREEPETILASAFLFALGTGSLAFVAATIRHVRLLHDSVTAAWCLGIALAVAAGGIVFVAIVLRR
jgi:hypothetical protein